MIVKSSRITITTRVKMILMSTIRVRYDHVEVLLQRTRRANKSRISHAIGPFIGQYKEILLYQSLQLSAGQSDSNVPSLVCPWLQGLGGFPVHVLQQDHWCAGRLRWTLSPSGTRRLMRDLKRILTVLGNHHKKHRQIKSFRAHSTQTARMTLSPPIGKRVSITAIRDSALSASNMASWRHQCTV